MRPPSNSPFLSEPPRQDRGSLDLAMTGGKVGLWDWNVGTQEVKWSEAVYAIHGVDPATFEVNLENSIALIHPEDRARVQKTIQDALDQATTFELECRIRRPDGTDAWVFLNGTVVRQDGRPVRMVGATVDITARRQVDDSSRWLAAIVDSSDDAILSKNLNSIITSWNAGAQRLFGYTAREMIGRSVTILMPEGRKDEEIGLLERIRRGERIEHYETVRQRKDGTLIEVSLTVSPVKDATGKIVGASKIARDISERKRSETAVRVSEERFRVLASHAPVGIFLSDLKGGCVFVNERWSEMAGLSQAQAQGNGWAAAVHPAERARVLGAWHQAVEHGQPSIAEFRFQRPDGSIVWVHGSAVRFDDGGSFQGFLGSCLDITQRKQAELQTDFLHDLSDKVSALNQPDQIMEVCQAALGEFLGVDRCYFFEVDAQRVMARIGRDWRQPDLPSVTGDHRLADFGSAEFVALLATTCCQIPDLLEHPATRSHAASYAALRMRALATAAFWQEGRWHLSLAIAHREPRNWSGADLELLENVVARVGPMVERARANRALQESETMHRQLLTELPIACYTLDADGRLAFFDEAAAELWGRRPVLGQQFWCGSQEMTQLDGQPLPLDKCPTAVALKTGKPVRGLEAFIIRPDGQRRWVVPYPTPLFDAAGRCTGLINVISDVTEQRAAQLAVQHSERQLRLVTDHAPVFIAQCDRQHRFKFVNQPYAERHNLTREDIVGRHISDLVGPEAYATFQNHMDACFAGRRIEFEQEIPYSTLGRRWVHVTYEPERSLGGEIIGLVAVVVDVTVRKQAELELARARDEALAAARTKDEFLASLSHELRTPLNPVLLLASDAANNPALPAEVRENFETIRRNISLEARLIDDLLDLTRIARGEMQLEKGQVDVHTVLHDAVANIHAEIEAKHLNLQLFLGARQSVIPGDAIRLQQVFLNVLQNAVKFTHEGGQITVVSRIVPETDRFHVEIADNGLGMSPAELANVFSAFSQGELVTGSPRFGGLGLGLAISRQLVELHAGCIHATSPGRNRGSVFVIELPLAAAAETTKTAPGLPAESATPTGSAVRPPFSILLVEDHVSTRETLKKLLTRRNYEVVAAGTVADALAQAAARSFDFLVSDVGLPDGDGYQLMAAIRKLQPGLQGIALSGYGMEDDLQRSHAGGFANHLVKPVSIGSLEQALSLLTAPQVTTQSRQILHAPSLSPS